MSNGNSRGRDSTWNTSETVIIPTPFRNTVLLRRKYAAGADEHLPVAEVACTLSATAETDVLVVEFIAH